MVLNYFTACNCGVVTYRLESLNMKCLLGAAVFSVVELGLLWENVLINASTLLSDGQGESVNTEEKEQRGNILIVCDLFNFIHLQYSMIKKLGQRKSR